MDENQEHPLLDRLRRRLAEGALSRRGFLRFATLLGVAAPLAYRMAGLPGSEAVAATTSGTEPSGGRLTLGMRVQQVENPHALSWLPPANLVHQVCQPLTWTGFDNVTRPYLLSSWKVSPDLRSWDLFVRRDVTWHSGRAFTADDVIWNLRHLLDPATGSSAMGIMQSYMLTDGPTGEPDGPPLWDASAIERVDDFQVRLNLKRPQVAVPEHLFHYTDVMLDPEENGRFGVGSNGTGPFTLRELVVGERALLGAARTASNRRPCVDELALIDLGDEPAAATAALLSGQIDGLDRCDYSVAESMAGQSGFQVHRSATAATAMLQMKVTRPPFDDLRVRRAMRLAIDPAEITRLALRGFGTPAEHHLVSPIHPDYALLPPLRRDVDQARRLIAEAGYPDGIDIEITCKNWPSWEASAVQVMVEQYRQAGIRCAIEILPAARFWDVWDKAPLAFVEWAPRPLGFMLMSLTLRSGVPWNSTGFSDAQVDALIQEAEATLDVDARRAILRQLEQRVQDIGPMVQPAWLSVVTVMSKRVRGFRLHPSTLLSAGDYAVIS
ncbi:ABC transporter substrate-binding protein [Pelagibius litoralis]|uniref:ABC transporter substrate-binding protein n=1 Tax=Pelagibius litoralis TaxID=374515 RepID=A0A967EYM5_9PROT|nr:ABC transporter substrate-binding protein [Pelagibius litoralis]NIA69847.1 ABC transporter substrate-binding protein [Pelagibius litoralis]